MGENEGVILGKVSFWAVREATRASFSFWVGPLGTICSRGFPPTKARYCSMVSFGGVDTAKSNIQGEREKEKREIHYLLQSNWKVKKIG